MISSALLIRGARQLLTLRGPGGPRRGLSLLDFGLIPDGAVIIANGIIQAVGSNRQILNLARARNCREIDAAGRVVMPAFVDPTASLVHARPSPRNYARLFRHYDNEDPEVFRDVLLEASHALQGLSSQTLKRGAGQIASGMLRHGTGTIQSRAPYGLDDTSALKILRVQKDQQQGGGLQIVSSCLLQSPGASEAAGWTDRVCRDLMPKIRRRKLATVIDVEFDPGRLAANLAVRILQTGAYLGFTPRVHSGFFCAESAVPLAIRAKQPAVEIARSVNRHEIEMLANGSTIALFTPGVDLQTGLSRHAPGRAMVDAGVIPGLASAYHPELSPAYSMQMILLLASRLYRFSPEEAISAATINNAHAIHAASSLGSIETGKQADVLVLAVSDYRELAYHAGLNVVEKVIKRGMLVYDSHADAAAPSSDADFHPRTDRMRS